jgi:hypothetical protein
MESNRDIWTELLALLDSAEVLTVDADDAGNVVASSEDTTAQQKMFNDLQLTVLGEHSSGQILVWSAYHSKRTQFPPDTSRITYKRALQAIGEPANVFLLEPGSKSPKNGSCYTLDEFQKGLAFLAGFHRLDAEREIGSGVWSGTNSDDEPDGSLVLVGEGEFSKFLNSASVLERYRQPRLNDRTMIDYGSGKWFRHDWLSDLLVLADDPAWCREQIDEAHDLYSRWIWKHPEVDPELVVGLILISWVQTVWESRPMVAVTGDTQAGKSTLFRTLTGGKVRGAGLFGWLAASFGDYSAAGIRQTIGHTAKILCLDEFDRCAKKKRDDLYTLLRTSTAGESSVRGSSGQKSTEGWICHVVWIAGIFAEMESHADRNRFIRFDLFPRPADQGGRLIIPPAGELRDLGQRLLAISIAHATTARQWALDLGGTRHSGVPEQRVIENYAAPAAILTSARGGNYEDALDRLTWYLERYRESDDIAIPDYKHLLTDILDSVILTERARRFSIGQMIGSVTLRTEHATDLQAVGLRILMERGATGTTDWLYINPDSVRRHLLQGTIWRDTPVAEILRRSPGVQNKRTRVGGEIRRGIAVPLDLVIKLIDDPVQNTSESLGF